MGIAAKEGQKASVQFDVIAVKARDLLPGDVVLCGGGIVRTVQEVSIMDGPQAGYASDRATVWWEGVLGAMNVEAHELFWAQRPGYSREG